MRHQAKTSKIRCIVMLRSAPTGGRHATGVTRGASRAQAATDEIAEYLNTRPARARHSQRGNS